MIILSCNNLTKSFGVESILENISFTVNEGDKIGVIGVNGTGKTTLFKIISGIYGYDSGEIYTSKDCEIGYLEQNTNFYSDNTIFTEVLEVFSDLIKMEEDLRKMGEIYTSKDCEIGYLEQNTNFYSDNTIFTEVLEVFSDLIKMEEDLRKMECEISDKSSENNSPDLQKLMDNYSHKLELFQNSNGYGYKSEAKGVLKGLGFNDDELEKPIKILSGGEKTRVLLAKLLLKKPTLKFRK